jgi:hypothetical protein
MNMGSVQDIMGFPYCTCSGLFRSVQVCSGRFNLRSMLFNTNISKLYNICPRLDLRLYNSV